MRTLLPFIGMIRPGAMNKIFIFITIFIVAGLHRFVYGNGPLEPSASFLGNQYRERVGYTLSGAGDINGDGFDDFMIGTFHHSSGGWDAGGVYLILGRSDVNWGMDYNLNDVDARFLGALLEAVGFAIAGRGDVNGDGYDDILIGAPAGNDQVSYKQGRLYIIFGKPEPDWGMDFYLYENADAIYQGENGQDLAGRSVAIIGDLNKDGCDEILCAAPYNDDGGRDAGKVYLIPGKREGWSNTAKLKNEPITFYYTQEWGTCGYSVDGIGDVNQDGIPDFAISALGAKKVFIVFGKDNLYWGGPDFNLEDADVIINAENILRIETMGWHVKGVGDVNGDTIPDILISSIDYDRISSHPGRGKVYLIFGRGEDWGDEEIDLAYADASYIGENQEDQAGWGIGGGGDINNDGLNDFFIGAWYNDYGYEDAGSCYLINGKRSGWENNVNLGTISQFFSGEDEINYAGYSVIIPGDIDGDEMDDYVISAPYNSQIDKWSGKIYLFASQRGRYIVGGDVSYYESFYPVTDAIVAIRSRQGIQDTTDNNGAYNIELYGKEDYTVSIMKKHGSDIGENTITEYDAALIARYAVKLDSIDDEISRSADVNRDDRITAYDAVQVLQYSLDLEVRDSYIGEWIFVPDSLEIPYLIQDERTNNFEGIIRGDVNASWGGVETLLKPSAHIAFVDKELNPDEFVLKINLARGSAALSFSSILHYDSNMLEFRNIERGNTGDRFTVACNSNETGELRLGGYTVEPVMEEGELVKIVFNVLKSVVTEDAVNIETLKINDSQIQTSVQNMKMKDKMRFQLYQNYPNPFNGNTEIRYQIDKPGLVDFSIYDTMGREVFHSADRKSQTGNHVINWNAKNNTGNHVATGIYFGRLTFDGSSRIIKLMYIK